MSLRTAKRNPDVASLLAAAAGQRQTGILTATKGKLKRLICLERGAIVAVASNLIEEQFDEFLVRERVLPPGERLRAKAAAARNERPLHEELEASSSIEASTLREALERRAVELVRVSLEFAERTCRFEEGRPDLTKFPRVSVSAVPLVLEHAERHPESIDEVRIRIGPPDTRPELGPAAKRLLDGLERASAVRTLLERADGALDVHALTAESPDGTETSLRTLMALLALRILVPAEDENDAAVAAAQTLTRDECLARVHRSEQSTHYEILGLDSSVDADAVRAAYYLLARRYHPDRFRTGPLTDLLGRMEIYFTRVTAAYNTLHDPAMRELYDEELGQAGSKATEPEQDTAYLARQNYARGRELVDRGRYADAVTFLENAVNLAENEGAYHLVLGQVLLRNPRRRADAAKHLERAIDLDPTSVVAKLDLGRVYRKIGRDEQAADLFREVLQWEPDNQGAHEELAAMGQPAGGR